MSQNGWNPSKNSESSSIISENQENFSEEIQEIVNSEVLKAKKELLDCLVRLEILNYSRYDKVYFANLNGYLVIIDSEIDV